MVFSSIALGLALLSKAAAGVRFMPGGASLINCCQFSLRYSISSPSSGGVAGVILAGGVVDAVDAVALTGSGAGLASGSGVVNGGSGEGGGVVGGGVAIFGGG